jgi:hypothetical protein
MSANSTPSKRSSGDDKSPSKPLLKITVLPSSLRKPKKLDKAVAITTMLTKVIHIEPTTGGEEAPCGFLLLIDGKLERNMHTPLYKLKDDPLVQKYVEDIGCLGHVFKPIIPSGTRIVNRKNYPMLALFFPVDKGTTMQEIRDNVELTVIPSIILHSRENPRFTSIEEEAVWSDIEYTKIEFFSYALDSYNMEWILKGMCLTDEDGSSMTMDEYWLSDPDNKYFYWPEGKLPILHMQNIPYDQASLHSVDWNRREAHFRGEDEVMVGFPAPGRASGTTRAQYAAVTSPTIETTPTICNKPKQEEETSPHAAANGTEDGKPAPRVRPEGNVQITPDTIPDLGGVPLPVNNTSTQPTAVGDSTARQLQLDNELPDDPIVGTDDETPAQPSKVPRKNTRGRTNGSK